MAAVLGVAATGGDPALDLPFQGDAMERLVQFKRIAVLTDLAAESEKIIRYAAALARWYGAELLLIHACSSAAPYTPRKSSFASAESGTRVEQNPAERLKSLVQELGLQDLAPRILVRKETISALISELDQYRPNLLVLATHGREGIRKWLAGSVAEEVFRRVQWPVLVIGPHCAGAESCSPKQLERVLYGTDLSADSVGALQCAAGISHDHESKLIALYVQLDPSQEFSYGRALAEQRLKDWAQDHIDGFGEALVSADFAIEFGKPQEKIIKAATRLKVDMIVLGARWFGHASGAGSHFITGTAYEVSCASPCPVLLVPHPH